MESWVRWIAMLSVLIGLVLPLTVLDTQANAPSDALASAVNTLVTANWDEVIGPGLTYYGVEYSWVDQDRELFLERYRLLQPNLVRVQINQEFFEPINDNADPNSSTIDFDLTLLFDTQQGKSLSYRDMFTTLAAEFPEMHFEINIWLAARWNAANPNGYLGLGGAFPPLDYAEHREFVRELARWLVDTCGIASERLSFSFVNEPNLSAFFVGTQADLVQMATETRAGLDEISPQIQMTALDEVHGVSWTNAFYPQRPAGCCDAWTFHAYEYGIGALGNALQTRVNQLAAYGPVWVTEFADTGNGSPDGKMDFSTRGAALGFAELVGRLWASGIDGIVHFRLADTYVDPPVGGLSGWVGHGLFADWRGIKSGGVAYAIYPAFWVFSNFYSELGGGQAISTMTASDLIVGGARRGDVSPSRLALWVTNPTDTDYATTVQVAGFPSATAQVEVLDNLSGNTPIETGMAEGTPLVFEVLIPARSSYTIRVIPTATPPPTPTPTPTDTPTPTPTDIPTPTATPSSGGNHIIYASSSSSGNAGGVAFQDEDILTYDTSAGTWSMYFDGSDVGLSGTDVNGFALLSDGSILMSFDSSSVTISGLGTVEDSDIVKFIPTSTGSNTAGSFEWFFDGSDVGLTTWGEDIDAIGIAPDGRLVISTQGSFGVSGVTGRDEDLIVFTAAQLGATTSGTWAMYFDGSDVGLSSASSEDVNGVWTHGATGGVYLTTAGTYGVSGSSGDGADIFICTPGSLGNATTCTFGPGLYWDGSANGFAGEVLDGFIVALTGTPVAADDDYSVEEDNSLTVGAPGVLGNDSDVDGDALTAVLVAGPTDATLTLNADGSFTYDPDADFTGTDSFTYQANDGLANSNIATVTITVNAVNDPPVAYDQSVTTAENTSVAITLTASDADDDPLTYSIVTGPANGTLSGTAPDFTYTPNADYTGTDSFTFKANDGKTNSNAATVTITVTAVNDPPVVNDQSVTTDEDTPVAITLTASDADGDPLTYSVVTAPGNGTLSGTAPDLTYTPDPDYTGTDSFTFKANDGKTNSNAATVTITVTAVNDPPVANDQSVTTDEDTPVAITLTASDADDDPLTYSIVTGPANGTLSGTAPDFTYTPNADYNGTDSFTFQVNDGTLDSNIATVSITVMAVNDPPIAVDDAYNVDEDTLLDVSLPGVLANDSDVGGDTLTAVLVSDVSHGNLTLNPDGSFAYTPDANFNGTDSFIYKANDGLADSNNATVTITVTPVNDPPVAEAQSVTTDEDTAVGITLTGSDPDLDLLTYHVVSEPTHGTLTGTGPDLTYTPSAKYNGSDSFTFKVNDGTVDSAPATVSITVTPVNDPPVADDLSVTTDEDTSLPITLTASDADGGSLTFSVVTGPGNGALTGTAPDLTYAPNADYNGTDSFTFKANDGQVDSNVAMVTITITAVNDPPVASDDAYSVNEADSLIVDTPGVLGNDSDVDGDTLTAVLVGGPTDGTLTLNADGSFTYNPDTDFNGTDSFTYKANDGQADSNVATVTITVESSSPPENLMHVNTIEVTKQTWWVLRYGIARVQIVDSRGSPVEGATITGQWSGGANDTDQFATGSDGWGTTNSNWRWGDATFTFCITNVSKEGWDYDPDANVVTCGNTD